MSLKIILPQLVASVSTGLLAGAFMYGFLNVVPTFYEVPLSVHLSYRTQLMNHNSITMQSLMVASIAAPLWYAFVIRSKPAAVLAIVAALLALTSLLVTRFGNVPINQLIKTWSVGNLPVDWKALLRTWDKYNLVRSLSALGCYFVYRRDFGKPFVQINIISSFDAAVLQHARSTPVLFLLKCGLWVEV